MAKNVNKKDNKTITETDANNLSLVEKAKANVVKAINLLTMPIEILEDQLIDVKPEDITKIAKSINLLEVAQENMRIACNSAGWNNDISYMIDDACCKLGICLAGIIDSSEDDCTYPAFDGKEALSILSKVLASLIRWNDEDE